MDAQNPLEVRWNNFCNENEDEKSTTECMWEMGGESGRRVGEQKTNSSGKLR